MGSNRELAVRIARLIFNREPENRELLAIMANNEDYNHDVLTQYADRIEGIITRYYEVDNER